MIMRMVIRPHASPMICLSNAQQMRPKSPESRPEFRLETASSQDWATSRATWREYPNLRASSPPACPMFVGFPSLRIAQTDAPPVQVRTRATERSRRGLWANDAVFSIPRGPGTILDPTIWLPGLTHVRPLMATEGGTEAMGAEQRKGAHEVAAEGQPLRPQGPRSGEDVVAGGSPVRGDRGDAQGCRLSAWM